MLEVSYEWSFLKKKKNFTLRLTESTGNSEQVQMRVTNSPLETTRVPAHLPENKF